ncbi:MAG: SMC-Scp complex subunit ScpB, partial [Clostridium sp.]|nr:SMC-Scp complex subunit ScpB [Clostridium sp.]
KQPVTRVEVDEIRGVNSDYVMGKLQEKGLIKALGRMDAPGRPKLYGTTDDFLIQFGFTSLHAMKEEHKLPEDILVKNNKEKLKNKENEDSIEVE